MAHVAVMVRGFRLGVQVTRQSAFSEEHQAVRAQIC